MSDQRHEAGLEDQFSLENQADGSKTPVEGEMKVGRDPGCELVLNCEKCSRVHAELSVDDDELWVQDRQSTNGTFVNNREISERTRLEGGDVVQFGDSRFRVVAPAQPAPEVDDNKTVVASRESLLRMIDDEKKAGSGNTEGAKEPGPGKAKKATKAKASKKKKKSSKPDKPASSEQSPEAGASPQPKERASAPSESSPDAGGGSATVSGESARSGSPEKPQPAPEHEERTVPPAGAGSRDNPSIPRSWADAEQLEQRSHTAVFVRGSEDTSDSGSGPLHPLKAIAQARLNTSADLAVLVGLNDPVRGTVFKLGRKGQTDKWELGRGEGADIRIDDDSVSGRHAQLIHERGRWKIVNMMSVNGTFVNGRKVLSAYLDARDVIRAGGVELVFDARIEKPGSTSGTQKRSAGSRSGVGSLFSAPFRWAGKQWAWLVDRFRGNG